MPKRGELLVAEPITADGVTVERRRRAASRGRTWSYVEMLVVVNQDKVIFCAKYIPRTEYPQVELQKRAKFESFLC